MEHGVKKGLQKELVYRIGHQMEQCTESYQKDPGVQNRSPNGGRCTE